MKRLFTLLVIVSLIFVLDSSTKNPTAEATPSIHQGDLIISGNDVYTIKNEIFIINGSIKVIENATLQLKDATVNFTHYFDHHILLYGGNPKLKIDNATIVSAYDVWMVFDVNSSALINNLHGSICSLETYRAIVSISNSDSHGYHGTGSSNVTISNCQIVDWESYSDNIAVFDSLTVRGDVNLHGYSTLYLENALLELSQTYDEELNITLNDHSSLESMNSAVYSNYDFIIYFRGDSTASVDGLTMPTSHSRLYAFDESVLNLNAFTSRYLRVFNDSVITLSNSAPYYLRSYYRSNFYIYNSNIKKLYVFDLGHHDIFQSVIAEDLIGYNNTYLEVYDSILNLVSACDTSSIHLKNCTYAQCTIQPYGQVSVHWYLDAKVVDMIEQPVPSANVTVWAGLTKKGSALTDSQGWARFTLLGKIVDRQGEHRSTDFSVYAKYEDHEVGESGVNMTDNEVVTLKLDFIIPEFPSSVVLPLFMVVTALAAIIYRTKRPRSLENGHRRKS